MGAIERLRQIVRRASADDIQAMVDPALQRPLQIQLLGTPIHQGQHDDPERVPELGLLEELLHDLLGIDVPL